MVTTWAQASDQTELESQLCHFPAARHGEEKTYNLLPLLESEAPRRTSTAGCREQGEHQQRAHQVPGTALSLSSRMFCSIILTASPTQPWTAQEKGSERLLAISPPGSPIPTSAWWNHKCTHFQSLGGEAVVFGTYMKTQNEWKIDIKNFRAVMQGKVSQTKWVMCLLRLAIHEAGPISNID